MVLHEEATACVAVPQCLWLLCEYDPRDRPDGIPNIRLFTITSDATWGAIRVTFWNASQAKIAGGTVHHLSACARP